MAGLIRYLLLANFFLLVLALFYQLLLVKETRFKTNRFVLISGTILSLVLPLFKFNWLETGSYSILTIPEIIVKAKSGMAHIDLAEIQIFGTAPYVFPWIKVILAVYIIGIIATGLVLIWRIKKLQHWTKQYPMKWFNNLFITLLPANWSPFSYMGIVYFPEPFDKDDNNTSLILEHERVHLREKHSWDILLIELVKIVFFYNPAVYTIQKQMQANHEYLADASAVGKEVKKYSQELIRLQLQVPQFQFIQQFNQASLLKRRLLMLMKNKQKTSGILKYLLIIPIIGGLVWFTACTDEAGPEQGIPFMDNPALTEGQPKSSVKLYSENILYSDYDKLNKWEKQIKVTAVEFNKTGASKEEVFKFVGERISHLLNEVPEAIESSELLKSLNLDARSLKNDYTMVKRGESIVVDVTPPDGETFFIVEEMPEFEGGGLQEFRDWVNDNVNYPDIALQNGISGTVYVNFIVDKTGSIDYVKIIRGVDPSLDDEVIRVIKQSPSWKPGEQRGKKVNVQMSIPVKFMLE